MAFLVWLIQQWLIPYKPETVSLLTSWTNKKIRGKKIKTFCIYIFYDYKLNTFLDETAMDIIHIFLTF